MRAPIFLGLETRGGDEEIAQILAAEIAAGNAGDRKGQLSDQATPRAVSPNLAAKEQCHPDAPFRIDRQPVGQTFFASDGHELATVGHGTRVDIVIKYVNTTRESVYKIHARLVAVPPYTIRDAHIAYRPGKREIRVDAIETSGAAMEKRRERSAP